MCMNQLPNDGTVQPLVYRSVDLGPGRIELLTDPAPPMRTESNFIRTYTGKPFWPLNPLPNEICIEDVAHALSLICHFAGQCYCHYSVAEHSIYVSELAQKMMLDAARERQLKCTPEVLNLAREIALWGLLHDASEAYLCDVPTPIKHAPGIGQLYQGHEARLMDAIVERFNLMPHEPSVVKTADRILLNTELRDLMTGASYSADVLPDPIFPRDAQWAEAEFLRRFFALYNARNAEQIANRE